MGGNGSLTNPMCARRTKGLAADGAAGKGVERDVCRRRQEDGNGELPGLFLWRREKKEGTRYAVAT